MLKFYDFFYIGLMVVSIAGATTFARGISNYNEISYYIYILLSIITIIAHKVKVDLIVLAKVYFWVIIFSLYLLIAFNDKMIGFIALIFPMIFHAYVMIATYKERFIVIFEKIVVFMSFVALLFWLGNILFTGEIENFVQTYQFSKSYGLGFGNETSNVKANIIFYTLQNYSSIDQDDGVFSYILRNPGFTWEPGAFSSIVILAMFCNAIINKFKFNRSLLILIIALLSSQSTTGLILFCIFLFFYAYNQSRITFFKLGVIFSVLVFFVLTSTIVENKFEAESNVETIKSLTNSETFSPRRWLSFQIDFMDFLHNPLGNGLGKYTWHYTFAPDVHTISGIGKILSYYGIFGAGVFIYFLIRSSIMFSNRFNYKGKYMLFILIMGILISYGFQLHPIFAFFWAYTLFLTRYKNMLNSFGGSSTLLKA